MKKLFKIFLVFIFFTVIAMAAAIPAVNIALENEELRNSLLQKLASSLDGELQADTLFISLDRKSLNISSKDFSGSLLNNSLQVDFPNIKIRITFADLLQGSLFPDAFQASSPRISYSLRSASGASTPAKLNWSRELNTLLKKIFEHGAKIDITEGTVVLASTTLSKLFIQTSPGKPSTALDMRTDILYNESVIPLEISGTAGNLFAGPFTYSFDVKAGSIPLNLVPASQDFFFSGGTADFTGKLNGSRQGIGLNGSITVNNLDMTVGWTSEDEIIHQEKVYRINQCSLALQGGLHGRKINFSTLDLRAEDFHLQGSFALDFNTLNDPFMNLRLRSDEMTLATLKMLLPDPLINDWTTQTIFPRLENGTARITDFVLAGTMSEIGRLDEPEHAHCLSWSGILRDVDTFYNDHKPLARVHNARLSMDGDVLEIKELSGESGKSTLTRGNLSISGLYDETSILTTDIQASFSLAWLTRIIKAGLTGKKMQRLVSPVSQISGQVKGSVNLSLGLAEEVTLLTLSGNGSAIPIELTLNDMILPFKMKRGDFTLAYPGTCVIKGKGSWGKSTFDGSLNLVEIDKKQLFRLNIKPDLIELKNIFTDNRIIRSLAPCIATLPLKATITLENKTISSSGSLDFTQTVPANDSMVCKQLLAENQLLRADYNISSSRKKLDLKNLALHTKNGNMQAMGVLETDRQLPVTIKNMNLQATDFPIQALQILMPDQEKRLTGSLDAKLKTAALSLDNIWQTINGSLKLKGWQGFLAGPAVTVNNMDLTATMDNGRIELKGTDIRLADFNPKTPLSLQADLLKKEVWNGTIRVYSDYLDLTTAPSLFREGRTDLGRTLPIGKIRIFVGVDHVLYRNLIFSPLLMQSYVTADRIFISKYLLQLDNNFIWLTGHQQGDEVLYQSFFKIRGKPVDTWMAIFGFGNEIITGTLDLEGKLTARVTPGATIFETTTGPIYFEIKNGSLVSSSTLRKILDLISLENIFDKKNVLLWRDSFNFDLIRGRFDLTRGVFSTNSLMMDAPAFDLFADGTLDVMNNTIKMQVKLAPFGTISKLFGSIPYLGYVLTGKTGSLFDYTFSVTGKIGNPDVQYTPLAGTVDSLTGYVKRLVSEREEVKKEVNTLLKVDMARKKSFILRMERELASLRSTGQKIIFSE